MRAEVSGISLKLQDAAIVKGMLKRGDRQHDIASWFGVNGGRIAEISTGQKFNDAPVHSENLPPAGPYSSGANSFKVRGDLQTIHEDAKLLSKMLKSNTANAPNFKFKAELVQSTQELHKLINKISVVLTQI